MKLDSLCDKLLAAARDNPPADLVPYAFEQRLLARLRETPAPDLGALWSRMLWRAAAPCVALALAVGVWSYAGGPAGTPRVEAGEFTEFPPDFEQTMLAAVVEQVEDLW